MSKQLKNALWAVVGAAFLAAFFYVVNHGGAGDVVFTGLGALGIKVFAGVAFARVILKNFDTLVGFDFAAWLAGAPPMAQAFYLGCRNIGVFVYFGLVLS